jgi:hypothetical protein
MRHFAAGDRVVYRKTKVSTRPGPRARDVHAAEHGDDYSYNVDKYWIVTGEVDDDTIEVMTRRGKIYRVPVDDPNLRKANTLEEIFRSSRFPKHPETKAGAEREQLPASSPTS